MAGEVVWIKRRRVFSENVANGEELRGGTKPGRLPPEIRVEVDRDGKTRVNLSFPPVTLSLGEENPERGNDPLTWLKPGAIQVRADPPITVFLEKEGTAMQVIGVEDGRNLYCAMVVQRD